MTNWTKIEEIAKATFESFNGMDAMDINCGDCSTFAKRMADALASEGIDFEIKATSHFELMDEMEGYEVEDSEFGYKMSHCYILVDGWGFDAFNVDGCEEREMTYLNKLDTQFAR